MNNKILALDVGARRIGVAVGDLETAIAAPKKAIFNDDMVFAKLINLIKRENFAKIVVGRPLNNSGQETNQTKFTRDFAKDLFAEMELNDLAREIVFQDESLTSVKAEENLKLQGKYSPQNLRNGVLDSEAAVVILTDFLESERAKRRIQTENAHENNLQYETIAPSGEDGFSAKKSRKIETSENSGTNQNRANKEAK